METVDEDPSPESFFSALVDASAVNVAGATMSRFELAAICATGSGSWCLSLEDPV